jgi:hypothetical protein
MGRRPMLALAVLCAAGALVPVTHAAWHGPVVVSEAAAFGSTPIVRLDPFGDAFLLWSGVTVPRGFTALTKHRRAGGFQSVDRVPRGGTPVDLAFNRRGDALALLVASDRSEPEDRTSGCCSRVRVALRRRGHRFEAPRTVSPRGSNADALAAGFDPDGSALAIWFHEDEIRASYGAPGGRLPEGQRIGGGVLEAQDVAVATADGHAAAVWRYYDDRSHLGVKVSVRAPGGRFSPPRRIFSGGAGYPAVAVAPNGAAVAIWRAAKQLPHAKRDRWRYMVMASFRRPGGRFGPARRVSALARFGLLFPVVAVDARGRAIAAWDAPTGIENATASVGGPFRHRRLVLGRAQPGAHDLRLAASPMGKAVLAWSARDGISAAWRRPGRHLGGVHTIFPDESATTLWNIAMGPGGQAIIATNRGDRKLRAAIYG